MVEAWVPVFLLSVLFALSMATVFLLSRIRERYAQDGDAGRGHRRAACSGSGVSSDPATVQEHGPHDELQSEPREPRERGSHNDGDFAADRTFFQLPHSLGCLLQRVAAVQGGSQMAALDEPGEPLVVGGALAREKRNEPLSDEG